MEAENLEYLKNQLKFLGFDEGLYSQLEMKMKEGRPDFTLDASHEFGVDKMTAVIQFKLGTREDKPNYYCNSYVATLHKDEQKHSQFVYVNNRGQSITFKEACNLLNGRSVLKEITPKEGPVYKAWLKIDHEKMDEKTGYPKLRSFGTNYGFDLHEAIGRMPFKELSYGDQVKTVMKSLEKGNLRSVTLMRDGGKEQPVFIEANPKFKTMNMYDKDMNKLYYPAEKVAQKYGKAPVDEKRQGVAQVIEKQQKLEKKDLLTTKGQSNGLLDKKNPQKSRRNRL
jgi:hypothetical protein